MPKRMGCAQERKKTKVTNVYNVFSKILLTMRFITLNIFEYLGIAL